MKTLKDCISEEKDFELVNGVPARIIWPGDLKHAAIEWIKQFDKLDKEIPRLGEITGDEIWSEDSEKLLQFLGIEDWIKHFFNLTEDDLK